MLIDYTPLIFINDKFYKGNYFDSNHLFESFCESFEELPEICLKLSNFDFVRDLNSSSLLGFIIKILLFSTLLICLCLSIFYILYWYKMKNKFESELPSKINEALARYYS